jgi:hypothetical protein
MSRYRYCLLVAAALAANLFVPAELVAFSAEMPGEVKIIDRDDVLRVEIGGEHFTDYHYRQVAKPYLYPIIGPGGQAMTRNWPMKEVPDEEHDHPHQKSLWFTHGEVNGVDFWTEGPGKGKIVHDGFLEKNTKAGWGVIRTKDKWVGPDGTVVCTDEQTLRFSQKDKVRFLDYEIVILASNGDLKFGDTKEGTLGIRLAETMRLKGKVGKGHIVNSEGLTDGDTWGKRAKWCDYYGPVGGQTVGVAIFDHPTNPRHPTWWHVRDYGLFAANPFGLHEFEKKPAGAGDLTVPAGKTIAFRYRFCFHQGDDKAAGVDALYKEYIQSAK